MKRLLIITALALLLFQGCKSSDVRYFWVGVPLIEDDLQVSEDRFADFATLAINSSQEDAFAALDLLFDKLKGDEVAYYVYIDWVESAFYNILSPCRSAALYSHSVDRIVSDGILAMDECEPFIQKRDKISVNLEGDKAVVPGVELGGERTLVLVLNLSCPSCRESIERMDNDKEWRDVRKVAVCCGFGPVPENPGWEIIVRPEHASDVFDIEMSPFYFVVGKDGLVEKTYTVFKY